MIPAPDPSPFLAAARVVALLAGHYWAAVGAADVWAGDWGQAASAAAGVAAAGGVWRAAQRQQRDVGF